MYVNRDMEVGLKQDIIEKAGSCMTNSEAANEDR